MLVRELLPLRRVLCPDAAPPGRVAGERPPRRDVPGGERVGDDHARRQGELRPFADRRRQRLRRRRLCVGRRRQRGRGHWSGPVRGRKGAPAVVASSAVTRSDALHRRHRELPPATWSTRTPRTTTGTSPTATPGLLHGRSGQELQPLLRTVRRQHHHPRGRSDRGVLQRGPGPDAAGRHRDHGGSRERHLERGGVPAATPAPPPTSSGTAAATMIPTAMITFAMGTQQILAYVDDQNAIQVIKRVGVSAWSPPSAIGATTDTPVALASALRTAARSSRSADGTAAFYYSGSTPSTHQRLVGWRSPSPHPTSPSTPTPRPRGHRRHRQPTRPRSLYDLRRPGLPREPHGQHVVDAGPGGRERPHRGGDRGRALARWSAGYSRSRSDESTWSA